jgi:hypothetical protein
MKPPKKSKVKSKAQPVAKPWPDLEARTRKIFGKRLLKPGGIETLLEARGER